MRAGVKATTTPMLRHLLVVGVLAVAAALRINCGGPPLNGGVVQGDSKKWSWSNGGVSFYSLPGSAGKGVPFSHAYARGKDLVYRFQVAAAATVTVKARFAEIYKPGFRKGFRLFRVWINGQPMKVNGQAVLDVFAAKGGWNSLVLTRANFKPANGIVTVHVRSVVENAMISGVDIYASTGPVQAVSPSVSVYLPYVNPPIGSPPKGNGGNTGNNGGGNTKPPAPSSGGKPKLVGSGSWRFVVNGPGSGVPAKRHEACAVLAKGKVYLIGGRGVKPVSVFDPKSKKWTNKKPTPMELNHMQCVAYGARIFVVGAWTGKFPFESAVPVTYVYNVDTDKWSTTAGLPPNRRRGGGATVIRGSKIFTASGNAGGHGKHARSVEYFDSYDIATGGPWIPLPNVPNPRDHVGGAIAANKFCLIGGRNGGVANFWGTPVAIVNCYNFNTKVWETGPNLPAARAGAATGALCDNDHIMVAGGEGRKPGTNFGGKAYARVDLYSVKSKVFRAPSFLKRGRHGSGLAITGCNCGNIYLPSGSGGLGGGPELNSMEVWSPDGVARNC